MARGGTLHQHLPDRPGTTLDHRQSAAGDRVTHSVQITPGSLLHRVMRRRRARVNSFHHQGINRLGSGLRAVAWSTDGVIEGVEAPRAAVRARGAVARRDAHGEARERGAVQRAGGGVRARRRAGAGGMSEHWADWKRGNEFTLGVEEETMLLSPHDWSLAQQIDRVLPALSEELSAHVTPETHRSALELSTGVHPTVAEMAEELMRLRHDAAARAAPARPLVRQRRHAPVHGLAGDRRLHRAALRAGVRLDARAGAPRAHLRPARARRASTTPRTPSGSPTACARTCRCCWRCR